MKEPIIDDNVLCDMRSCLEGKCLKMKPNLFPIPNSQKMNDLLTLTRNNRYFPGCMILEACRIIRVTLTNEPTTAEPTPKPNQ